VIADEQVVKVHIHSEQPGTVLQEALQFGQLERIKIDNMRLQHEEIVGQATPFSDARDKVSESTFAFVAVANGLGMIECFRSLGATSVIEGGQSMNPSAEQFMTAFAQQKAKTIFVLPNNANVIMAARQAAEISEQDVRVIPSRSMQQGIATLIAFQADASAEYNEQAMTESLDHIRSGSLTQAVRDSEMDELSVREGDYIGLHNQQLAVANQDLQKAFQQLIEKMIDEDSSLITIYSGQEANSEAHQVLNQWLQETYTDVDIEWYNGGQPVYHYLISVE
jgi:DAK2 domain fusion protein YloV